MSKANADVLVYILSENKQEIVSGLAKKVGQLSGVVKATISPKMNQLMEVKYDPKSISSSALLSAVRDTGHSATLVGM